MRERAHRSLRNARRQAESPRWGARARRVAAFSSLVAILLAPSVSTRAFAYTIQSQLTDECHETITADALREVRSMYGLGAPLPYSDPNDGPLVDDLPFSPPDDLKDIGGATLLLGVRDNDVKSLAPTALDDLAQVTADPATQREHCLRTDAEKEPTGSALAVADCRAFIKQTLMSALDGLGADGTPDGSVRDSLTVSLALSGTRTVNVPTFYLRAGRAVHAIEDSFSHSFRTPDQSQITVVLNWVDYANNSLDEATDGPPHMKELDRCDDPDALRTLKHQQAVEASVVALHTVLDPTLTPDEKSTAIDALLDTYVSYDTTAGCTSANDWCNAAENAYRSSACACSLAGASRRGAGGALAFAALVGLALHRRRSRRRSGRVGAALGAAMLVAAPTAASAQQQSPLPTAPEHVAQGPVAALNGESQAAKPGTRDPAGSLFAHVAFAASYDHAALAFALGGKYQFARNWMVGADVEWNPWIPVEPLSFRAGSGNIYGSLVRRYQMAFESVNFRTTAALGMSTLLIDLPGANKWSFGPFVGVSFIGVEVKVAPGVFLVVDPTYFAFPVPHVTGVPLGYYQYRFQVGIEFGG
jgi:MYXO-CTERM domain-containing protein